MVMPAGNLIGGNLVTPNQTSILTSSEIAQNLIPNDRVSRTAADQPGAMVVGDSKTRMNNYAFAGVALSRVRGVVTGTVASFVGYVGAKIRVKNAPDASFNGTFVLASITGSAITYAQDGFPDATTSTSNIDCLQLYSDQGPVARALAESTRPLYIVNNAGVSGEKAAQIAAREPTEDYSGVGVIILDAGTNDLITYPTPANAYSDIDACINAYRVRAKLIGAELIVVIPAPPTSAYATAVNAGAPAAFATAFRQNRDNIYRKQATTGDFIIADYWERLTDRGATNQLAYASPAVYTDGLHYSAIGAAQASPAMAQALNNLKSVARNFSTVIDVGPYTAGAASVYTGITGTVVSELECARGGAATGVASVPTDTTSNPGVTTYKQKVDWTFTANNEAAVVRRATSKNDQNAFVAGDVISVRMRVKVQNAVAGNLKYWGVNLLGTPTGGAEVQLSAANYQSVTGIPNADFDGVILLPPAVVPAVGLTGLRVEWRGIGGGASGSAVSVTVDQIEYVKF